MELPPDKKRLRDKDLISIAPIAFPTSLKPLMRKKREQYLAFERAYQEFYRLWVGSGDWVEHAPVVSRALDRVQRDMEYLRAVFCSCLQIDLQELRHPEHAVSDKDKAERVCNEAGAYEPMFFGPDGISAASDPALGATTQTPLE